MLFRRFCIAYLAYLAVCYGADYLLQKHGDVSIFGILSFLAVIEALRYTARRADGDALETMTSLGYWKLAAFMAGFIALANVMFAMLESLIINRGDGLEFQALLQVSAFLAIGVLFWTLLIRALVPWLVKRNLRHRQLERLAGSRTD